MRSSKNYCQGSDNILEFVEMPPQEACIKTSFTCMEGYWWRIYILITWSIMPIDDNRKRPWLGRDKFTITYFRTKVLAWLDQYRPPFLRRISCCCHYLCKWSRYHHLQVHANPRVTLMLTSTYHQLHRHGSKKIIWQILMYRMVWFLRLHSLEKLMWQAWHQTVIYIASRVVFWMDKIMFEINWF